MSVFCVDLDGTLAPWDKTENYSKENFEPPYPGAKEFLEGLSKLGGIIIYTARCNEELHSGEPIRLQETRVEDWLKKHSLPYDKVWVEKGKPVANIYIDDRGFRIRPEDSADTEAHYIAALAAIRTVLML
jgi:hypothetical protein